MRQPDRRGFLTWLAGAAAFRPARALGQEDLAATFRRARPCRDLRELADAAADTFEYERLAMGVERALADMLEDAKLPLDAGFEGPSPMPSRYSVRDGLLFGEYASGEAFRSGLEEWVSSLGTVRRAMFHALPGDVVRFEVSSEVESRMEHRVGAWRMAWQDGRLVRFEPLEETLVRSEAPLFADVTAELFGSCESFRDQLAKGIPYWRSRIDVASGIGVYGNQGVSVGDIDGDGWDEVYVCQPAGLPNRLYSRQVDGTWVDITADAGVDVLDDTSQALFLDLRNIGVQDLVVLAAAGPLLFLNDGSGRFRLRERAFQFETPPKGTFAGMAAADFDRDGLVDLYLCSYLYFRSEDQYRYPAPYHNATNGPPNFLLRNELGRDGQGRFTDVTEAAGFGENNDRYSFAAAWCDYDEDGWPELYVANDFGRNNLYKYSDGRFRDIAEEKGVQDVGPGMSAAWFDYDGDGRLDLYVTNMWTAAGQRVARDAEFGPVRDGAPPEAFHGHTKGNSLYRNLGGGSFEYSAEREGVEMGRWSWAGDGFDFDLDGTPEILVTAGMITHSPDKDLCSFFWRRVVAQSASDTKPVPDYETGWNCLNQMVREDFSWNGNEPNVFYARRDGRYRDFSGISGLDLPADSRAFAVTDLSGDGRPDLVLKSRLGLQLRAFYNQSAGNRKPLVVELEGTRSNRDAIGAIVKVETDGGTRAQSLSAGSGYVSQHTKRLSFGLGEHEVARRVTVRWPSGGEQAFENLAAGYRYRIREGASEPQAAPLAAASVPEGSVQPLEPDNRLVFEPTWLMDPVPLPEPAEPGFLILTDGGLPRAPSTVPFEVVDLSAAPPDRAAAFAIFRRYLFDYRTGLRLPLVMLVDSQSKVHKVYPGLPDEEELRSDHERLLSRTRDAGLPFEGRYYVSSGTRNHFRMGSAFLQAGYPALSLPYLREAAMAPGGNFKAWLAIGQIELQAGNLAEAESWLERAASLNSEAPQVWNNLGGLAMAREDFLAASEHFQRALDLNADLPYALVNAAQARSRLGDSPEAERLLRRALELDATDSEAANQLGLVVAKQGRLHDARTYFQRAIENQRDHIEAINNLAILYVQLGQVGDAIAALRFGIEQAPDFATSYMNLARLHADRGDYESSRQALRQLLERSPEHAAARQALLQLQGR